MKCLLGLLLAASWASAEMRVVALAGQSPLITFRLVFTTGSAADPPDKPGVAWLTARMLADGGTRTMTYRQLVEAMFPMAASVHAQVDKEMTTFTGETHVDNLEAYYRLLRAMLLDPGWREDDFTRLRDEAVNQLRVGLRGNNEEELAKEVLYQQIYAGTPYEHYAVGTVSSLQKITMADLKTFYRTRYAQANLILGIAGGYPAAFLETMKKDFQALPAGAGPGVGLKPPAPAARNRLVIIDKETRAVAVSIGFPIGVRRGDPDFPALLVAQSWFGQHRTSGGRLYDRMREQRGLNYGDYAYIEYFPNGMFLFDPSPNLARGSQIFQVWIRPVEPPTAKFALRLALYELDRLVREGIPREGFERTREFLGKYVNILTQTKSAELGYRIDSLYYGIPDYNRYVKAALAKLTVEDVNRAVRRHLRADRLTMVAVSKDAAGPKAQLTGDAPSPITYNSPKPAEITAEDQVVQKIPLHLKPEDVAVVPVGQVFE